MMDIEKIQFKLFISMTVPLLGKLYQYKIYMYKGTNLSL